MNTLRRTAAIPAAMLLAALASCSGNSNSPNPSPGAHGSKGGGKPGMVPAVAVAPVKRAPIAQTLQLTGTVEPVRTARLASPVEGPVQTLWVREGDTVKGGTVLLDIGRKGAVNAQLAAAREYLQNRELELERVGKLVAQGAVPESELDGARAQHENARVQYARASEASGDFRIRAPWRGIVSQVLVQEGDFVVPRAQLLHLYDPARLIVVSSVPETRAHQIRDRALVEVRFDAYPGRSCRGTVSRVYPRLDPKTRTRTFEVTVNDTVSLIPGMFARLAVETARADSALVVPKSAVVVTPKGKQVAWFVANKKVSARPVTTGIQAGDMIEITGGLSAGEVVVVAGNEKLKDGAQVRIANPKGAGGEHNKMMDQPRSLKKGEAAETDKNEVNPTGAKERHQ
jgi:membrane fusion protein (multidrug efflux system)